MRFVKPLILLILLSLSVYITADYQHLKFKYALSPIILSYYGSTGPEVIEIQKRLKQWGYYDGPIDGIYGYKTYMAVRYFQAKNGLKVDGIAGSETLRALGIVTTTHSSYSSDLNLLAHLISAEARGEPYVGQVAVGAVVLNRVRHPSFPNSIAGVIYQPGAFESVANGQINLPPTVSAINAARDALNGWDPTGGALYFFNPAKTTNKWIWSRPIVAVIGNHVFAR
ncbi:spore cortex-lytic enzyme [Caldicellulosiruptor acetigenus I77R1B]|uniref:Spore cortex-lytic enzyme n=1 Tax=Caldicellulosiruptor acetigenus (strain ATCC 700853 / DSM 12137 / I77R1B) TaxID=632335 RepID=E4S9U0_CALA7|nr:spore cortex-lytic enzyme [Caldicellulosiruptor acetigenus]ADQ41083.1 spore cortex-lytic enzyme [Caldicellulosiruptor acetigenus I77R1B]